jgi:hypothetical protein
MKFDTIRFLEDYNIPYLSSHSILTKDFVGISTCPFCNASGGGKPYFAMRRHSTGTNCWICHTNDFYGAIQRLTGITDYKALKDIYNKYGTITNGIYTSKNHESSNELIKRPAKIDVPGKKILLPQIKSYLKKRDFDPEYIWQKYDLKSTTYDKEFGYRMVLPIKYENRNVSYTGRDYTDLQDAKYMSCKKELEIIPHKSIFYGIDNVHGKNALWIEGPTDVWRISDGSISSFGTEWTLEQLMLLHNKFENVFIMFDGGEEEATKHAENASVILNSVGTNCEIIDLYEEGDPDELFKDEKELIYLKKELQIS